MWCDRCQGAEYSARVPRRGIFGAGAAVEGVPEPADVRVLVALYLSFHCGRAEPVSARKAWGVWSKDDLGSATDCEGD